jgi:hypothetical protein
MKKNKPKSEGLESLRRKNFGPARLSGAGSSLEGVTAKKAPSDLGFPKVQENF